LFIDFKNDESYTPNKISIRAGTTLQDLKVNEKYLFFSQKIIGSVLCRVKRTEWMVHFTVENKTFEWK